MGDLQQCGQASEGLSLQSQNVYRYSKTCADATFFSVEMSGDTSKKEHESTWSTWIGMSSSGGVRTGGQEAMGFPMQVQNGNRCLEGSMMLQHT